MRPSHTAAGPPTLVLRTDMLSREGRRSSARSAYCARTFIFPRPRQRSWRGVDGRDGGRSRSTTIRREHAYGLSTTGQGLEVARRWSRCSRPFGPSDSTILGAINRGHVASEVASVRRAALGSGVLSGRSWTKHPGERISQTPRLPVFIAHGHRPGSVFRLDERYRAKLRPRVNVTWVPSTATRIRRKRHRAESVSRADLSDRNLLAEGDRNAGVAMLSVGWTRCRKIALS